MTGKGYGARADGLNRGVTVGCGGDRAEYDISKARATTVAATTAADRTDQCSHNVRSVYVSVFLSVLSVLPFHTAPPRAYYYRFFFFLLADLIILFYFY